MLRARTDDLLTRWRARPLAAFALVAGAVTLFRIAGLLISDANLGPDEAQYWLWSKTPAFGYFSKPPLIAWAIGSTTALFGDGEWAVRLSAPVFHAGAAAFLFALARRLYGGGAGFWTGVGWLALPGAAFSSALITTDAPLLFFWSAALYFFFRIQKAETRKGALIAALALGAAVGLGFLSKYAMIYFLIGAAGALAVSHSARRRFRLVHGAVALVTASILIAPNALWNSAHDFQTISHTAANANWGADLFRPKELLEFLAAQFGVFGPVTAGLFIWGCATLRRRLERAGAPGGDDLALLAFAIPPLAIVSVQAFIARAHANWAAAAYPAALVLVTAWAFRARLGVLIRAGTLAHLLIGAGFIAVMSNFAFADALGLSNAVKRVRGWPEQGAYVRLQAEGYDAILVDDRELIASLLYYARGGAPIRAWNSNNHIDDHFEAFMAYDAAAHPRALFVALDPEAAAIKRSFEFIQPVGEITADLRRGRSRTLYLFEASKNAAAPAAH